MEQLIFKIMDWLYSENDETKSSLTSDEKLALYKFVESHLNEMNDCYSNTHDWYEYIWKEG